MNLTGAKENSNQKKECQMCQKNHDLDACFKYKQLQVDEKKKFLMKSKLYFGCYDVIIINKGHSGKNCPQKRKWNISKQQNLTGFYGLQSKKRSPEKEDDNHTPPTPPGNGEKKGSVKTCALTVAHTEVISVCVIQVKVKYKDSNSVYRTLAMLDNFARDVLSVPFLWKI